MLCVGEMTWPSGDKYIGDWEEDKRNGHGLYLFTSGNRYKGQYVMGRKVRMAWNYGDQPLTDSRRVSVSFGGRKGKMQVISILVNSREIKETAKGHITLPMETSSQADGSLENRMDPAIKHSLMEIFSMEAGKKAKGMEFLFLLSQMVQGIKQGMQKELDKVDGIKLNQFLIIQTLSRKQKCIFYLPSWFLFLCRPKI